MEWIPPCKGATHAVKFQAQVLGQKNPTHLLRPYRACHCFTAHTQGDALGFHRTPRWGWEGVVRLTASPRWGWEGVVRLTASARWGWEGVVRHAASPRWGWEGVVRLPATPRWGLGAAVAYASVKRGKKPALHRRVWNAFLTAARRVTAVVTYRVEMSSL